MTRLHACPITGYFEGRDAVPRNSLEAARELIGEVDVARLAIRVVVARTVVVSQMVRIRWKWLSLLSDGDRPSRDDRCIEAGVVNDVSRHVAIRPGVVRKPGGIHGCQRRGASRGRLGLSWQSSQADSHHETQGPYDSRSHHAVLPSLGPGTRVGHVEPLRRL